jgi:hypothetical protein
VAVLLVAIAVVLSCVTTEVEAITNTALRHKLGARTNHRPSARRCLSCLVLTETIRELSATTAAGGAPVTNLVLNPVIVPTCTIIQNYITTNVAAYPVTGVAGNDPFGAAPPVVVPSNTQKVLHPRTNFNPIFKNVRNLIWIYISIYTCFFLT